MQKRLFFSFLFLFIIIFCPGLKVIFSILSMIKAGGAVLFLSEAGGWGEGEFKKCPQVAR